MPAPVGGAVPAGRFGWSHGLLYCVASLVLGIELNIVGPTVSSLAAQVGVTESALGGVVGLGGIGLLVGGIPSGWLLDKLPGHAVLAGAATLQAFTFCLLPHCAHLAVLAATYCAAALTFNAITTGANALILWCYPSTQAAWLNLASALFGVGCFLAPVLADLASSGSSGGGDGQQAGAGGAAGSGGAEAADGGGGGGGGGAGGGGGPPFSLRGGAAATAYYLVAAGAAGCAIWALLLPSPPRPEPHVHHDPADLDAAHGHSLEPQLQQQRQQLAGQRRKGAGRGTGPRGSAGGSSSGGSSVLVLHKSPSFASVLDLGGLESSATDSPPASVGDSNPRQHPQHPQHPQPLLTVAPEGCGPDGAAVPAAAAAAVAGTAPTTASGTVTSWCSCRTSAARSDVADVIAPASLPYIADGPAAVAASGGGSGDATEGCFGSALSSSSPAATEPAAGASRGNPLYGTAAAPDAADVLSAAAAQITLMQLQQELQQQQQQRGGGRLHAADAAKGWLLSGGGGGSGSGQEVAEATAGAAATSALPSSPPLVAAAAAAEGMRRVGGSSALFRRYIHELRMGWPVLLPVVLLLFANISTQASFGAWVTTYCRRAVGLDESAAQAVTAAYWAAFTGTRLAGVAVAPFLHASNVLLITSPFAVAGSALAVLGLPHIPGLHPHASSSAAAAAFAAGLPSWALYTAVCLVGVGVATGFANTVSLTGDHLRLDGFTNGILSSVAGLASTLCPAAVPWLAEHTGMGYGALMAVALAMSGVQLAMVVAALVGARWVDEWQRREDEEEEEVERLLKARQAAERLQREGGAPGEAAVVVLVVATAAAGGEVEEEEQEEGSRARRGRTGRSGRGRAAGGVGGRGDGELSAPLLTAQDEEHNLA